MSDEEDYMSDQFLAKLNDVRPSLIQDRGKKRQLDIETKKQEDKKRQREDRRDNRNERLQESLKKEISVENKGFQLLAKMGYKPGQALGKHPTMSAESKTADQRLTEPLPIKIKDGRSGLGREAALIELNERRQQLKRKRLLEKLGAGETLSTEEFRRRATVKAEERFILGALKKCQSTCENLDTEAKVEQPEMTWFWPERFTETVEESTEESTEEPIESEETTADAEIEYLPAEKLEMLTNYLRTAYLFCFWCGVKYEDTDDLSANCPGLTRDDH